MNEVPKFLYRGIKVKLQDIAGFDFKGDITPYYESKTDDFGREIVRDGNEYGIYMSDNKRVAMGVYGKPDITDGTIIIKIGLDDYLRYPCIGIVYEIDTDNILVRRPWITGYLKEVYNNGFQGNEYITDFIPRESYKIIRITIGEDYLHKSLKIDVDDLDKCILKLQDEIKKRITDINNFASYVKNMPKGKQMSLSMYKDLMVDLFGSNGIANRDDFALNDDKDGLDFLLKKEMYTYDFQHMKDILSLKRDLKDNFDDVLSNRRY